MAKISKLRVLNLNLLNKTLLPRLVQKRRKVRNLILLSFLENFSSLVTIKSWIFVYTKIPLIPSGRLSFEDDVLIRLPRLHSYYFSPSDRGTFSDFLELETAVETLHMAEYTPLVSAL